MYPNHFYHRHVLYYINTSGSTFPRQSKLREIEASAAGLCWIRRCSMCWRIQHDSDYFVCFTLLLQCSECISNSHVLRREAGKRIFRNRLCRLLNLPLNLPKTPSVNLINKDDTEVMGCRCLFLLLLLLLGFFRGCSGKLKTSNASVTALSI